MGNLQRHPPPHGTQASEPARERAAVPLTPSAPLSAWLDFGLILSAYEVVTEVRPELLRWLVSWMC